MAVFLCANKMSTELDFRGVCIFMFILVMCLLLAAFGLGVFLRDMVFSIFNTIKDLFVKKEEAVVAEVKDKVSKEL